MSESTSLTVPAAGWYPDRSDPRITRWWDGQQWTDHTREVANAVAASVSQPVSATAFGIAASVTASVAAGWYPDNTDPRLQRWWDGQQWTAHTAPRAAEQAPAYAAAPTYGLASAGGAAGANAIATRGLIFSLIGLIINPFLALTIGGIVMGIIGLTRAPRFAPQNARRGAAIGAIAVGIGAMIIQVVAAVWAWNMQHPSSLIGG